MKLAVVTSEFPPINAAAAARIGPWVKELDSRGHQVAVYSSKGSSKIGNTQHFESKRSVPSNKVGIFRRFYQEMRLAWDLSYMMKTLLKQIDGVVITSPPFFLATHIAKLVQRNNVPYIFDVRDRYPHVLFDLNVISEKSLIGRRLSLREKTCYGNSALITSVTKGIDEEIDSFQKPHEHIPNGFDGEIFDPNKYAKKDSVFRVVYHGRFSRLHDIDSLREISLRVKELNPNIEFLIIGPIPEYAKNKLWGNVCFAGEQARSEIPALLSTGSIGISLMKTMNSTKVAMPAKVYEYIGMGLPIVVAPEGELHNFVINGNIGLAFKKTDSNLIADSLVALEKDQARYEQYQKQIRSVRTQFDRKNQSMVMADLIEKYFGSTEAKKVNLN
ncbi:MAG: glycosyltransferase family 4 protein [Verrucomicrobiota bacterium]|nr:glycosyltransferase family 4 protein [Verrucomicrobiota bacterium]